VAALISLGAAAVPAAASTPTPPSPATSNTLIPAGVALPNAAAPPPHATGTPKTFKVYATREGLVGHTTANGHKVLSSDHFVSLPSAGSLSAKGKNYYSVSAAYVRVPSGAKISTC
jgi:hypothetical protein